MRTLITIAIIPVTVWLLFLIGRYAIADFLDPAGVPEEKYYRPFARLVFGAVAVPILLAFVGWFTKSLYRK